MRHEGRNLSYFLTLALTLGGGMAALHYLLTGQGPSSLKDYFFPKTGRKNDDDSDERLQLPNYWVDHHVHAVPPAPFWLASIGNRCVAVSARSLTPRNCAAIYSAFCVLDAAEVLRKGNRCPPCGYGCG
ncbi:MAG: hypothetical protein QM741_01095 [Rudaea sp.]|uniref:hypothetical protein n=1 Tax=Rudaea sp. TaxID=2136325 RepID=UPI0039E4A129